MLNIVVKDTTDKSFTLPDYQKRFDFPAQRNIEVQRVLFALYDNAYLAASYDSVAKDSVTLTVFLTHGKHYEWAYLGKGNVDEGVLSQLHFREKVYQHSPFYYKDAFKLMDKVVTFYEDHGYPFAQMNLDSVQLKDNSIAAVLHLQKKELEKVDSIIIKGTLKVAPQYMYGYLGIKPGDLYSESKVRAISARLKALPFLSETKPTQVIFVKGKAKIILNLNKRSANQFNGIVGILPNNTTGKITITGDVNLQLQNSFRRAEELGFHWQHLQPLTENLAIHFSYPYLFNTPFGIDEDFKLFKQDTTYLQVDEKVGFKYLLIGGNYWKVFYENIGSSLLSTSTLQFTSVLPPYADNTTQLYGIEYKTTGLDYIYNPRKGYDLLVNVAAGTKTITENPKVNPLVYEGLQLKSNEYKANLRAAYYIPVAGRSAVKLGVQGGYLNAPSLLYNDMYRIGGFNSLRGVDEQSIYASAYSIGTVEFHYLLEQNSFLFVFFDQGLYQKQIAGQSTVTDNPYGFGAGMNFQTKAGIFSIDYALGKEFSNPVNFKSGKISFGIVSYF